MTSDPRASAQDHTITPTFSPRRVAFEYRGVISDSGIKTLCEYIDLARDLYQPTHLAVQLDSPGGSARALDYWLYRIKKWGEVGVEIETRAGTECASAAALALAFGAVGRRFAHPLTRLHFHNPRLHTAGPTEVQEHHAEDFARVLKASRSRMQNQLNEHLINSLGKRGFVQTLFSRAQWLQHASCAVLSRGRTQIGGEATLHANAENAIEVWSQQSTNNPECIDTAITEWELRLVEMFARDCPIDLRFAWALLLIDESDHLPSLIERSTPSCDDQDGTHCSPSTPTAVASPSCTS